MNRPRLGHVTVGLKFVLYSSFNFLFAFEILMLITLPFVWKTASDNISHLLISICRFQNSLINQNLFNPFPLFLLCRIFSMAAAGIALDVRGRLLVSNVSSFQR
jgi:hypothetical protein